MSAKLYNSSLRTYNLSGGINRYELSPNKEYLALLLFYDTNIADATKYKLTIFNITSDPDIIPVANISSEYIDITGICWTNTSNLIIDSPTGIFIMKFKPDITTKYLFTDHNIKNQYQLCFTHNDEYLISCSELSNINIYQLDNVNDTYDVLNNIDTDITISNLHYHAKGQNSYIFASGFRLLDNNSQINIYKCCNTTYNTDADFTNIQLLKIYNPGIRFPFYIDSIDTGHIIILFADMFCLIPSIYCMVKLDTLDFEIVNLTDYNVLLSQPLDTNHKLATINTYCLLVHIPGIPGNLYAFNLLNHTIDNLLIDQTNTSLTTDCKLTRTTRNGKLYYKNIESGIESGIESHSTENYWLCMNTLFGSGYTIYEINGLMIFIREYDSVINVQYSIPTCMAKNYKILRRLYPKLPWTLVETVANYSV